MSVFVVVGTRLEPFMRLLDEIDRLAGEGLLEDVFVQSGHNPDFAPRHCRHEPFMPLERFEALIAAAELVICHAGAGTTIQVIRSGKIPLVMPRRLKHGENVDDHQMELTRELVAQGRAVAAYEPADLEAAVGRARELSAIAEPPPPARMLALVREAIEELLGSRSRS